MSELEPRTNRRTVLKGAAWSVPVIAAAGSVPMASASPQPEIIGTLNVNNSAVHSHNAGFVTFQAGLFSEFWSGGPAAGTVTLDIGGVVISSYPFTLPPNGQTWELNPQPSFAHAAGTFPYTITWVASGFEFRWQGSLTDNVRVITGSVTVAHNPWG